MDRTRHEDTDHGRFLRRETTNHDAVHVRRGLRTPVRTRSMMDVVGNNVANVNTVGFKSSRVHVRRRAVPGGARLVRRHRPGHRRRASTPSRSASACASPAPTCIFTQGGSAADRRPTDVVDPGRRLLRHPLHRRAAVHPGRRVPASTRAGFLTDPAGGVVQGWMADNDGQRHHQRTVDRHPDPGRAAPSHRSRRRGAASAATLRPTPPRSSAPVPSTPSTSSTPSARRSA